VVKHRGVSFTVATIYVLARAANAIPEFRRQIRTGEVVEHSIVHPSTTILTDEDLFSLYTIDCVEDFSLFAERAAEQIADVQQHPTLKNGPGRDDLLYMTAIPWVSFTSFMHPPDHPANPVPRFAWGRFYQDGESRKMPLRVQAHHAPMDGVHMGSSMPKYRTSCAILVLFWFRRRGAA
jgi:chloramphenicol O-acetyltransferase type A